MFYLCPKSVVFRPHDQILPTPPRNHLPRSRGRRGQGWKRSHETTEPGVPGPTKKWRMSETSWSSEFPLPLGVGRRAPVTNLQEVCRVTRLAPTDRCTSTFPPTLDTGNRTTDTQVNVQCPSYPNSVFLVTDTVAHSVRPHSVRPQTTTDIGSSVTQDPSPVDPDSATRSIPWNPLNEQKRLGVKEWTLTQTGVDRVLLISPLIYPSTYPVLEYIVGRVSSTSRRKGKRQRGVPAKFREAHL